MAENDFLPFASETGANIQDQTDYAGSGFQTTGQQPGIGRSATFNKIWHQGSLGMAVLAAFIVAVLDESVLDSGYTSGAELISTLLAQFQNALSTYISGGGALGPTVIPVTYSATPNLNFTGGNRLLPIFEITLTGNAAPTLSNVLPGQVVGFLIHQDGVGGHTWTWPGGMSNFGDVDSTANSTTVQTGIVQGNGTIQASSGVMG